MAIVIVPFLGHRLEHRLAGRDRFQRRQRDVQVVIASSLCQQLAAVIVDGEHLLPRREFGGGASRGIHDVLPFGEVVGQRGRRDLHDGVEAVVDPGIQRPCE